MVFIVFLIVAIITVIVAAKLSKYADIISKQTAFGGMLIGSILLSLATSLPELTTSVTAILIDNPDIAVGNLLGSNLFNMLIIAVFHVIFYKLNIFQVKTRQLPYYAILGILLSSIVLMGIFLKMPQTLFGMGLDTLLIIAVYSSGMSFISSMNPPTELSGGNEKNNNDMSVKNAFIRFLIAAVIILISGSLLTMTGDRIAEITGMGSSFVGSFLIAASTSLPEAVSVYVAIQMTNYRLAVGSVLSSNLFNLLLLSGTDLFYWKGPLLAQVASTHQWTASAGIVLISIVLYSLKRNHTNPWLYTAPSVLLIALYFLFSYIIFYASV